VAEATRALAERWPWPRLHSDPDVVDTAEPPLERRIALWMDDGMFARVALAELAPLGVAARSVRLLLPQPLLDDIDDVLLNTVSRPVR
jgi:hypothetical protein